MASSAQRGLRNPAVTTVLLDDGGRHRRYLRQVVSKVVASRTITVGSGYGKVQYFICFVINWKMMATFAPLNGWEDGGIG